MTPSRAKRAIGQVRPIGRVRRFRLLGRLVLAVLVLVCVEGPAYALSASREVGGLEVTVYAPDWTWQRQNINILVVIDNPGTSEIPLEIELKFPEGASNPFEFTGESTEAASVAARSTIRRAFTDILARAGAPTGRYAFSIELRTPEQTVAISYPVETIRGAAVSQNIAAAIVPAALASAWCVVIFLYLGATAGWRSWLTSSASLDGGKVKSSE